MRELLSKLIADSALNDERVRVLSGDHGYALFDRIRSQSPEKFVNVGVAEQAMVGIAAGMATLGLRPIVYGLSAFVPIRVLEQIKLDVCFSKLPVIFIGDGAGLVYSTLGASHQAAEDIAVLRPLPEIKIFSPASSEELQASFEEARRYTGPTYLRIGKADRALKLDSKNLLEPITVDGYFTHRNTKSRDLIIAHGAFSSLALNFAQRFQINSLSLAQLKPEPLGLLSKLETFERIFVIEEHSRSGALFSALAEMYFLSDQKHPKILPFTLKEKFSDLCGDHQFALSEHALDDKSLGEALETQLTRSPTRS